jgi:hypothetical protein
MLTMKRKRPNFIYKAHWGFRSFLHSLKKAMKSVLGFHGFS